tara:strand:+ start:493 stop:831 length:339 start_codon:yes stop_codon:yes gene_type:complete
MRIRQLISSRFSPKSKQRITRFILKLKIHNSIKNWLDKRSAEVCLISFPKSGRTWLRLMIGRALQLHFGLETADILKVVPLAAMHPLIPKIVVDDEGTFWKKPQALSKSKSK